MFDKEDEERELRTGGSPAFMAPELCMSGTAKVSGKATDIWALGENSSDLGHSHCYGIRLNVWRLTL